MRVNNNIVICVGQAGLQIGASFWDTICQEHLINPKTGRAESGDAPIGDWNAFFDRVGDGDDANYVPRTVMVDLEPSVINQVRDDYGNLFNPSCLISSDEGASGNFAVGFQSRGREILPEVMQRIEEELKKCDNIGSVIVIHSLGGGTGSGLGCALIRELKKKFAGYPILSCAVLPSPKISSVVTEPYNTVFALAVLKEYADACLIFDNEALFQIARDNWELESPEVTDLNHLITDVLAGITCSMRFSGFMTVEVSVRELMMNLVPKPHLHFLISSTSPLTPPDHSKFEELDVEEMTRQVFQDDSSFAACSPMRGRYLSAALIYRGMLKDKPKADAALAAIRPKIPMTPWIPTAFKIGSVREAGIRHRKSITLLANNTEIAKVFERICGQFDQLWKRQAFANWYFSEGMEEEEIDALRTAVGELATLYKDAERSGGGSGPGPEVLPEAAKSDEEDEPGAEQSADDREEELTIRESDEVESPGFGNSLIALSKPADTEGEGDSEAADDSDSEAADNEDDKKNPSSGLFSEFVDKHRKS